MQTKNTTKSFSRHTAQFHCHTALDAVSPDTSNNAGGFRVKPAMTVPFSCHPELVSGSRLGILKQVQNDGVVVHPKLHCSKNTTLSGGG